MGNTVSQLWGPKKEELPYQLVDGMLRLWSEHIDERLASKITSTTTSVVKMSNCLLETPAARLFAQNPMFASFILHHCELSAEAIAALFASNTARRIRFEDTRVVREIGILGPNLIEIVMMSCNIGVEEANALAKCEQLTSLGLCDNNLGAEGAVVLSKHSRLRVLRIGHNKIGDKGAHALSLSTTITDLNVSKNDITEIGAAALARSTTLESLYICGNSIKIGGAKALSMNTSIQHLCIMPADIGEIGVSAFIDNTTLTCLRLVYGHKAPPSVESLAANTTLTHLVMKQFPRNGALPFSVPMSFQSNEHLLQIEAAIMPMEVKERLAKNRRHASQICIWITILAHITRNKYEN